MPGRGASEEANLKVVVVGGGAWGTAFARVLADRGHEVTLGCRSPDQARMVAETGRNPRYLPEVRLDGVQAAIVEETPQESADLVVLAVPSRVFASVIGELRGDAPLLSLTKGLDPHTGDRLSTLAGGRPYAMLSGPNFAEEVAAGLPAAAVVASEDERFAGELQSGINSMVFRIYVNHDLVGVELCAAAKNVIALAAGGVDGLALGDNAKAALLTRGLAEMARLGEAFGAEADTFAGLAGMGDLIATCWHPAGRNRRAGELIARGATPAQAVGRIGTVEGLTTAPVLRDLSRRAGIELPITEGVCAVVEGHSLTDLVRGLMGREPTSE